MASAGAQPCGSFSSANLARGCAASGRDGARSRTASRTARRSSCDRKGPTWRCETRRRKSRRSVRPIAPRGDRRGCRTAGGCSAAPGRPCRSDGRSLGFDPRIARVGLARASAARRTVGTGWPGCRRALPRPCRTLRRSGGASRGSVTWRTARRRPCSPQCRARGSCRFLSMIDWHPLGGPRRDGVHRLPVGLRHPRGIHPARPIRCLNSRGFQGAAGGRWTPVASQKSGPVAGEMPSQARQHTFRPGKEPENKGLAAWTPAGPRKPTRNPAASAQKQRGERAFQRTLPILPSG
ncbi:hypothetical protein EDC22_10226 [Tepidamorphus gemmatus]|uniref:Uncharacterized protein n=1 Tax=Tepidamorphus gemmatus TaxID=747076 RepID=A0A4R3MIW7_9HYPH|nr:hypothetical protein EDC22_10226 [Tepidamorphus gemmatus]